MAQNVTSGTTVGGAVTTVTFSTWYAEIEIINRSSGDMWARIDGVDPTIAGDDCLFIPAQSFLDVLNHQRSPEPALGTTPNCVIKILTASAAAYTVGVGV
jgi:hypothetical protein